MNKAALDRATDYIDSWLDFRYKREDIPGYTVAIAHKGKIVFNKSYGYADLESKTKLTPGHLFRIASHSKTFTATAIMQLAEKGKLRIDDPVVDYLPWLKENEDKRWLNVTIRQLLSHGAGVIRDGTKEDYWQLDHAFPSKEQFKKEMLEAELILDNNIKMKYSNYGYTLIGLIIEVVSGEDYNDYVTNHIIKPLGLKNTYPEYEKSLKGKLVTGYTRPDVNKKRLPIAQVSTHSMSPATGFCSNSEDLCTYFNAHKVGSGKLLTDESKKEMQRAQWKINKPGRAFDEDYCLGLESATLNKRRIIGHGGGFPGHNTKSWFDPENELAVIVLTNVISGPSSYISKGVFQIIDFFEENTPTAKPKRDFTKLEGRYMNLWYMVDIVSAGDKLIAGYPDFWEPFYGPETLKHVSGNSFKVSETDSFASEGEIVNFQLKDSKVVTVDYTGSTMWPEDVWLKKQASRKLVDLP